LTDSVILLHFMSRDATPADNLINRIYEANTVDKLGELFYTLYVVDEIDPFHFVPLATQYHPTFFMEAREQMMAKMKARPGIKTP
jgi:hypothetical protein